MIGKKLVIISHTEHQILPTGQNVGWGPTISEINQIAHEWEEVVHIACLTKYSRNDSLLPYLSGNIRFKSIPQFGGKTLLSKLDILYKAFTIVITILKNLKGASHVQIRVPMGIGIYILPLFTIVPRRFNLWVKYANNWENVSTSFGYKFQRWFLIKNFLKCKVTINGFWPNQPKHCMSFENPCISHYYQEKGKNRIIEFNGIIKIVFVGRLEKAKGLDLLLEIWGSFAKNQNYEWIFIGEGNLKSHLEDAAQKFKLNVLFTGLVSQERVHEILSVSHFLILPSKTEGFPKVIAESWNYGVIPIISPVGSIPHYAKHLQNCIMLDSVDSKSLLKSLRELEHLNFKKLVEISCNGRSMSGRFTFENYIKHLKKEIFN